MTTSSDAAVASPREVVENVRRMVEGSGEIVDFADLFAEDGVLEYPFAIPGMPERLEGREAIRSFHGQASRARSLLDMEEVNAVVHETTDPEVVVAEIEHHGMSRVTGRPYRSEAFGVIRVRDGEIVSYRDYMNPIKLAELTDRMPQLLATLSEDRPA